ncbi:MAG: hypothetical protein MZV70_49510 [Desulfobacterales bacterium]|nr:hypothetical protein [Desulfobacterales bacterium]
MDFPDDFRLNFYFAEALAGANHGKALDLYRKCVELYAHDEKNKRYSEEYQKALDALKTKGVTPPPL